jgi:hypothetical protein
MLHGIEGHILIYKINLSRFVREEMKKREDKSYRLTLQIPSPNTYINCAQIDR